MTALGGRRTIRVFLAGSSPILVDGLCRCLEQNELIDVVGAGAAGVGSAEFVVRLCAHVVVLSSADDATERMVRQLTAIAGDSVACLRLGDPEGREACAGAVSWDASVTELCEAILAASRTPSPQGEEAFAGPGLSSREVEVLCCAAAGQTNFSIARTLSLSEATVKTYWQRIFKKLSVHDRTTAVVTALNWRILADIENVHVRADGGAGIPEKGGGCAPAAWLNPRADHRIAL